MATTSSNPRAAMLAVQQAHLANLRKTIDTIRKRIRDLSSDAAELERQEQELLRAASPLTATSTKKAPVHARAVAAARTPAARPEKSRTSGAEVLLEGPRGANARGRFNKNGLLVLKGSEIAATVVPSMPAALQAARRELLDGKVVSRAGGRLRFQRDHFFASVSTAASVVMGRNANGWKEWRDARGRQLGAIRAGR